MMITRNGKRLKNHVECYEEGYNVACRILCDDFRQEREKLKAEISALKAKLDAIETERNQELDALARWSDEQCRIFGIQ